MRRIDLNQPPNSNFQEKQELAFESLGKGSNDLPADALNYTNGGSNGSRAELPWADLELYKIERGQCL